MLSGCLRLDGRYLELIAAVSSCSDSLYFPREPSADTARNLVVYCERLGSVVLSEGNALCQLPLVLC